MVINMLGNISETKSMGLGSITLLMDIVMKEHGMKDAGKAMACTVSEMAILDVANGMLVYSSTLCLH